VYKVVPLFKWYDFVCTMSYHFSGLRGIYSPISVDDYLTTLRPSVRPSICLSAHYVRVQYSIETAEDVIKFLSGPDRR